MYNLNDLNPVQREAVAHREGPLLILAGAGSGKTRVLTYRIAHLIAQGIEPWNILAITFTNKAAKEMRERVEVLVGSEGKGLWVTTFHAACVRILRREIGILPGYTRNFVIYDSGDQQTLIKACIKECDMDEKKFAVRSVASVISEAKNKLLSPSDFANQSNDYFKSQVVKVYELYQKKLRSNNALDFDDIIMLTVQIFLQSSMVLNYYQEKFRYIMIDEYQDTNHAQYILVKLLASRYRNLCVVGDDDQSVYGWRGADVQNILDFERDYPEATVLKLEQNYRSTQRILQAANAVVKNNEERKPKALWTENQEGQPLIYYEAENEHDEARYMVERIQRLHNLEGRPFSDFSILYRTNAQSRVIEEYLMREGMPYRIFSGLKFYDRMEIKDILAYLRVINNPADTVSFSRILNVPKRGLGSSSLDKILEYAEEQNMPVLDAIHEAEYIPDLQARAKKTLAVFAHMIQELRGIALNTSFVTNIIEEVLKKTGYWEMLETDKSIEAQTRLENIQELISVAAEFDKDHADALDEQEAEEIKDPLAGFLENVSLVADIDHLDQSEDAVVLMTMHSAKGLEFPVVFLGGMEEGIFPSSRSFIEPAILEEERRLCYVAITRAREKVYLCYASQRMIWGKTQYNQQSCFLEEIPPELMTEVDPLDPPVKPKVSKSLKQTNSPLQDSFKSRELWSDNKGTPIVKQDQKYHVGQKIEHMKFGKGIIVSIKGEGSEAMLTIAFDGELKNLIAEYAKLKLLHS